MRASELIEYIKENGLENYEVMIQVPRSGTVPLEEGDVDWNEDMEKLYLG